MDGLEAARRARKDLALAADLPIIAMTANTQAADRAACLASGEQLFHVQTRTVLVAVGGGFGARHL